MEKWGSGSRTETESEGLMRCNSKTANYVYCHFCFAGCSWLACLPKEAEKEGKRGPAALP